MEVGRPRREAKIDGRIRLQCGIPTKAAGAAADHAKDGQTSSSKSESSIARNRTEWKELGKQLETTMEL